MFRIRAMSRTIAWMTLPLVLGVVLGEMAMAQEDGGATAAAAASVTGPVWAVAYIVVLMLVGLGTFSVVRSSRRRDRAKPQEYSAKVKA